jgi:4-alpha-glucanotransferase
LRAAYRRLVTAGSAARREAFDSYKHDRGRPLEGFAAFETLRARWPDSWRHWPEEWRIPDDDMLRRLRASDSGEIDFHQYLQWNAEWQLRECRTIARERGLSIGLYLDTAIGVDPDGADAWMDQREMLAGLTIGAPPDQYNPAGQDWGLTAYNPHGLIATNFEPFRQMLRAAMRYAGAIRIDHVLGLMRLYVIPRGLGAQRGAYLRCPFEALLAVVAEESRRWHCIVIGEDLGTVPENFRAVLSLWGLLTYLVLLFERNWDGSFRRPDEYRECAIATFGTHDLPTFTGWMSSHDLRTKRGIGIDPGESDHERDGSRSALNAAVQAATGGAQTYADAVAFLAATPTRLVSIGIEDVLELKDQVNVPGTVTEHPNWRLRLPVVLEELGSDQRLRRIAAILAGAGRGRSSTG